jgi:hypothetical protein
MINIGVMITATAECGDIAEIAREAENLGYESFWFIFVSSVFFPEE